MRPVPMSRFPLLAFVVAVPATTRRSPPSTTRPTKWAKFTSIAIGTDGFPVISYFDNTAGDLKVAKCNDAACTGNNETITTVDSSANYVGQYTSIALGADGFPVISYYDLTHGKLKVAKCNDAACTGNNETITSIDDSGIFTSIALGTDGLPVISYYDPTAFSLKVVKCTRPSCSF